MFNNSLASTSRSSGTDGSTPDKEYVVRKLCERLRANLSEEEWRKFDDQRRDRSRIELFVGRKIIQSCVQKYLKFHPARKDKAKAMILKSAGNKAFGSGDNEKALYLYTQCLAWMPHDETKDDAIVYANRSAALFHLEEFLLAKKDAELAFSLNYPNELHYKLYERVGRCCIQLGNNEEAGKNFLRAVEALQSSGLDELKMKKTKRVLEELIKAPNKAAHGFNQNQDKSSPGSAGSQTFTPSLPDIAGGRSKYLKCASSRLTLEYREKQGRFVFANEGFKPGEVILVEKAYISVLLPEQYHRQCFQCYSPLKAPIVCQTCILVSFCSKKCQEKAQTHHRYECSILGLLKNSGISVICYMAVRIFTQTDPKNVLGWYELAEKTEKDEMSMSEERVSEGKPNNCRDKTRAPETLGFNEEYRTDHIALFHLVTHSHIRKSEGLFHQIIMALYLLETLKTTSYFDSLKGSKYSEKRDKKQETSGPNGDGSKNSLSKNGNPSPDEPTKTSISQDEERRREEDDIPLELELKFAVLLLRLLKSLQFNTHETFGWDPDKEKDNSVGLGGALYPTLALFNHSCNPAIVRYFLNDTVVVRAVRTILPGEVVTENYGPNYSNSIKEERQAKLLDYYWFQCDCIACREDWPTFENMTNEMMKFRCENCRTFICKAADSMGILFNCGKCGKPVNIMKSLKAIHKSDDKYSEAVKFINSGHEERGLGMLLENLFLLETFLMPPFREYHMCQEHIRRCYLNSGNKISKLPTWDPETLDGPNISN